MCFDKINKNVDDGDITEFFTPFIVVMMTSQKPRKLDATEGYVLLIYLHRQIKPAPKTCLNSSKWLNDKGNCHKKAFLLLDFLHRFFIRRDFLFMRCSVLSTLLTNLYTAGQPQ